MVQHGLGMLLAVQWFARHSGVHILSATSPSNLMVEVKEANRCVIVERGSISLWPMLHLLHAVLASASTTREEII